MKKVVFGLMIIGLANLVYSQGTNGKIEEIKLSGVEIAPRNLVYIDKVSEGTVSERVLTLERQASRFNIKESPFFDNHSNSFEVSFKQKDGNIRATYDRDGKILSSSEMFKNIALPQAVRNNMYKESPGWTMQKNAYLVTYSSDKDVKKVFKIQVRKDNVKKYLKLDIKGNRLN